ncbi:MULTISPECIES: acyltransferase family protein [Francisella]|uniref:acyltransferase family protein n=1 Tax=Francisella TaxID=262 RepID=UPI0011B55AF2|nr:MULTISPECIES: acyltransferase family protein [Francisella]
MSNIKYIDHIDGLRALAVISVIFVHLDYSLFSGGFIGVDIFFVISGYLITKIIIKELRRDNKFNFLNFYTRRIRRILPALIFTLITTLLLSTWLLNLASFKIFGGSLATSALSISNFFFNSQAGYFDIFSQSNPLLHTWSLAVEEQFYIFWPIGLLIIYRINKKLLIPFIMSIFTISIIWSIYKQSTNISNLYYLTQFRAFEFCIGAILTWLDQDKLLKSNKSKEIMCATGFIFVFYPIFYYNSSTLFPSYNALLPTIGAGLLILSGSAKWSGYILRVKAIRFIGLISYSLYLIHWPMIVFVKTYNQNTGYPFELSSISKLVILIIALIVASVMYYTIEQPFRKNIPKKNYSQVLLVSKWSLIVVIISVIGASIFYSKGWLWRAKYPIAANQVTDLSKYHIENWGGAGVTTEEVKYGSLPADIILMGDSHAGMLERGLIDEIAKPFNLSLYGITGGDGGKYSSTLLIPGLTRQGNPIFTQEWNDKSNKEAPIDLSNHIKQKKDSVLIYSAYVAAYVGDALYLDSHKPINIDPFTMTKYNQYKALTDAFEKLLKIIDGHKLIIIGNPPESFNYNTTYCLSQLKWFKSTNHCQTKEIENNYPAAINVNNILNQFAKKHKNVYFINPYDTFCENGYCNNVNREGIPFYSDGNHLSKTGSIYLLKHIKPKLVEIMKPLT